MIEPTAVWGSHASEQFLACWARELGIASCKAIRLAPEVVCGGNGAVKLRATVKHDELGGEPEEGERRVWRCKDLRNKFVRHALTSGREPAQYSRQEIQKSGKAKWRERVETNSPRENLMGAAISSITILTSTRAWRCTSLALRVLSSSENVPSDDAVSTFGWGEVDVHAVAWVSCFCKLPFSEWKAIANDVSYKLQSMVERNQTMLYGGTERGTRIPSGYYQWVDKLLETICSGSASAKEDGAVFELLLALVSAVLEHRMHRRRGCDRHLLSVNRTWNKTIYDGYVREALLQTGVEAGSRRRAFAREAMMRSQRLKERAMTQMRHWREGAARSTVTETLVGPACGRSWS